MKVLLIVLGLAALAAIGVLYAASGDPSSTPSSTTSSAAATTPQPQVSSGAASCDAQPDTVTMAGCFTRLRAELEGKLEAVMERLEAALLNLENNPDLAETPEAGALSEIRADLANAEEAWQRYRDTVCHAAVLYAIGGTFRNVVGPRCDVIVLEERIRVLEESFGL
ncbi:MAG: DUF1311 domain-containing protein [Actinobacteria bacterium]|nr:DUF1311 domain-containing protein [Actinomycetota bacterium]